MPISNDHIRGSYLKVYTKVIHLIATSSLLTKSSPVGIPGTHMASLISLVSLASLVSLVSLVLIWYP